jgi:hypothetical protein
LVFPGARAGDDAAGIDPRAPPVRAMKKSSRTILNLAAEDITAALEFASRNSDHPILRIA